MKKILTLTLAAAALLLAACNKDVAPQGDTFDATFTVNLQKAATKAVFSDGTSATKLQVIVYSTTDGYLPNVSKLTETINMTTTVTLKLVKGKTYDIAFWAQNENGPYTVDPAAATMTVTRTGDANDENRDAFYRLYNTGKVTGPINETIELRRPFAQINVFTTEADYAAAQDSKVNFTESGMKLTAPSVLDLRTGNVSTPVEYVFSHAAINVDESTKLAGYKYIAMNYVLAAATPDVADVNFSVWINNPAELLNEDLNVTNVPYRRNYKTNIIGNIFSVDGTFNVIIVPEYETPDYTVEF